MSHIAMHQIKHANDCSKRSDALDRLKPGDRTDGAPLCNRMNVFRDD
jgi:hypothetical protein